MEALGTPWGMGSVLVVCLLAFGLSWLGVRVKLTRDGLVTSRDDHKPEPLMPERYARYSMQLIERAIAHNNAMRDLWPRCLEEQMRVYEEREVTALGLLTSEFSKLVDRLGLSETDAEEEVSRFRAHLGNALVVVKDHVRKSFRNNHYYEMGESEWEAYLRSKARSVADVVSGELDKFWRSPHVSRAELKAVGQATRAEHEALVSDCFKRARAISISAKEQETEERARYMSWMANVTGLRVEDYWCR